MSVQNDINYASMICTIHLNLFGQWSLSSQHDGRLFHGMFWKKKMVGMYGRTFHIMNKVVLYYADKQFKKNNWRFLGLILKLFVSSGALNNDTQSGRSMKCPWHVWLSDVIFKDINQWRTSLSGSRFLVNWRQGQVTLKCHWSNQQQAAISVGPGA